MLQELLPVVAPQVAAGPIQPPPPPPLRDSMIVALMLCGFTEMAVIALQRHGMNSIDNMSVMDTTTFTIGFVVFIMIILNDCGPQ
jgi:hypothetical protein